MRRRHAHTARSRAAFAPALLAALALVVGATLPVDARARAAATDDALAPRTAEGAPAPAPTEPASQSDDEDETSTGDDARTGDGDGEATETKDPATTEPLADAPRARDDEGKMEPAPASRETIDALAEASLERVRVPVERLGEHYLGSTARPVRFDWRNALFMLAIHGGEIIERNNFGSFKLGGTVRRAFLGAMFEAGVSNVFVLDTESSRLLALTPYRQASRPPRVEIEAQASYPIFEGVVTPVLDIVPPSEMVFSVTGAARYLLYPQVILGERDWSRQSTYTDPQTWQDISASLATTQLNADDRRLLERRSYGGMLIDPALVQTLAGFTFDAYYQPGLFFSARALLGVPAITALTGSRLGFFWEMSCMAGWAF